MRVLTHVLAHILISLAGWIPLIVLWVILDSPLATSDASSMQIYATRGVLFLGYLAATWWWSERSWRISEARRIRRG